MSIVASEENVFLLDTDQLYKLALTYFKENEGRNFHVQFDEKLSLVALTQQANHGNIISANLPPLGTLDVIGKQRRAAWALLGDLDKIEAKHRFIEKLLTIVPAFQLYIDQKAAEEKERKESEEEKNGEMLVKEKEKQEAEVRKQKEEKERRNIQDILNKQTFSQFKVYAEQQYPDNPDQQAVLIKQLQEQHFYQYMQQLHQQQAVSSQDQESETSNQGEESNHVTCEHAHEPEEHLLCNHAAHELEGLMHGEDKVDGLERSELETSLSNLHLHQEVQEIEAEEASMWTRKDINEFKETISREEGDAIIKIGHGETVTVRVPTHKDGKSLYWEFATDGYDVGFGLFFEWVEAEDTQVTVHISDSEDEEEEEDFGSDDEEVGIGGEGLDPESGKKSYVDNGPPTTCIVPIYRRDCHEEVYAGSHNYPAQGVYLLKFDNTFSLWRSKTLYYRVYYTRKFIKFREKKKKTTRMLTVCKVLYYNYVMPLL
ncbi:Golgi resident protein GCP60 isoform X5 [Eurytemora carolleeae]|uniref:Golgi resident protein GCP60 isoform X5 n=1 Tax=Eurytemora carolleeae TaxID=1294199 RepID=UPI000C75AA79|nr:Golgi resident protein GCP60 isoform X5 [Eurytemora carolleeae]|eukprot:XP_023334195.1 Golgi resident protein GCP60-like isoform X5 [Eurytemora affinis]